MFTRSHLQSFPRSHRCARRNVFQIGYVVFPRSLHGSRRNVFQIGYAVSPAEFSSIASWLTQKCLSDWLRGLTCRDFLDRIVAHAQTSFRLVAPPHLQSFPRSHRGSRSRRNVAQISYVVSTVFCSGCTEFFVDRAVHHRSSNVIKFHGSTHRTK